MIIDKLIYSIEISIMSKYFNKVMATILSRIEAEKGFSFVWTGNSHQKALSPKNLSKLKKQEKESTNLENYFNQKFGSSGSR